MEIKMKNITLISLIFLACTFSSYGMEKDQDHTSRSPQKPVSSYKRQDPDEMMRRFKELTPPDELQRIREVAHRIAERSRKERELLQLGKSITEQKA
jgi:hypothetical protein